MPLHHAVRTHPDRLAFTTHTEAQTLWRTILREVPDPMALCLMPDHLHLLHARDVHAALGVALRSYARWRHTRLGVTGSLWRRPGPPDAVQGQTKLRRSERYVHLNPCRAGLASDPLAWPWSTHRDRVGLALPAARARVTNPHRYHHYVSADPTVHVHGTDLPIGADQADLEAVVAAVSSLTRTPMEVLDRRGSPRQLLVRSLRLFTPLPCVDIARQLGLHRRSVERVAAGHTPATRLVSGVLGDPRFDFLQSGDLRRQASWRRYRGRH